MKKFKLGYIGLGKMGLNMVLRMREKGYEVVAYNRSEGPRREARKTGITVADSVQELVRGLPRPRTVWLMVSNYAVDEVLKEVLKYLDRGDTIIDGGNSFYKDSIKRCGELLKKGIDFLDVGVSGGPKGAREGACIMIGGKQKVYEKYEQLFKDLAVNGNYSDVPQNIRIKRKEKVEKTSRIYSNVLQNIGIDSRAYAHVGKSGAGHFVKMVHNGIEYGMMQAIAEGFAVMKKSEFKLDLEKIANLYNHKSVVESRLVGWLASAYKKYGTDLAGISGSVAHTGEGAWTVKAAKELGVPAPIIGESFRFRVASAKNPSYIGRVLSVLRNRFGGHNVRNK